MLTYKLSILLEHLKQFLAIGNISNVFINLFKIYIVIYDNEQNGINWDQTKISVIKINNP